MTTRKYKRVFIPKDRLHENEIAVQINWSEDVNAGCFIDAEGTPMQWFGMQELDAIIDVLTEIRQDQKRRL